MRLAIHTAMIAAASVVLMCTSPWSHATEYPAWWITNSIVNTNAVSTNDYAAANAGQLKWFATNAYDELEENLPGGAGTNVENVISTFTLSNNYYAINLGQLKNVSKPFYDRLIEEGYCTNYPWTTGTTTDDVDYACANLGQLKNVFDFDLTEDSDSDSLSDWWELHWFGSLTNQVGTNDYDSDGLNNVGEYQNGVCPTNSDTDADAMPDGWEVDHSLDPTADDASSDPDGDGLTNLEEYTLHTDPQDHADGQALLEIARARITASWYMVMTNNLTFTNTPGSAADLTDMKTVLNQLSGKFYRVVTQ